jgi:WhiB family redox-sensing transcriptional regulator
MTERERRALLRRRPTVDSWRELLETAREEYEREYHCGDLLKVAG